MSDTEELINELKKRGRPVKVLKCKPVEEQPKKLQKKKFTKCPFSMMITGELTLNFDEDD